VAGVSQLVRHASEDVRTNAVGILGVMGQKIKAPDANAVCPRSRL